MIIQLIVIGYLLVYIFEYDSWVLGVFIILIMISLSSLIVLRNLDERNIKHYGVIFLSIAIGGSINLYLVIECVLSLTPFYTPQIVVPIAGMIYANAMNAVSLAAERFDKERSTSSYDEAKRSAFRASMIPNINSFLAVGVVSLPGMMTGQILSGVDPLIAVRYQIVVMAMVLGSSGMSVVLYLFLKSSYRVRKSEQSSGLLSDKANSQTKV
jgi:putative ABC transport system permease protein